jgi:hypothetical protein
LSIIHKKFVFACGKPNLPHELCDNNNNLQILMQSLFLIGMELLWKWSRFLFQDADPAVATKSGHFMAGQHDITLIGSSTCHPELGSGSLF